MSIVDVVFIALACVRCILFGPVKRYAVKRLRYRRFPRIREL